MVRVDVLCRKNEIEECRDCSVKTETRMSRQTFFRFVWKHLDETGRWDGYASVEIRSKPSLPVWEVPADRIPI